ncbi:DUF3592 domain-containing protein [Acidovorax soli]|uniref:DUF3592 domain-containing protein n=1 Tax=Acidovorax soli TaxID=592050 RepID=UPI0032B1C0E5
MTRTIRDGGDEPALGWGARLLAMLFSGLFALVFGGVAYLGGLRPLGSSLHAAWEVRDWQPVPIQVLDASLDTHTGKKGQLSHAVRVRYRYEFRGRSYEASRVGLDEDGLHDSVGDWHQRWLQRLQTAREGGTALQAWVNPRRPQRALLDRELRWPMLLLHLPFALVFPAISLGAALVFWRALSGSAAWRTDRGTGVRLITGPNSASRAQLGLWLFAFFWCGIAFPLATVFWLNGAPWWVRALTLLFVGVGLLLLGAAARQSLLAWRYRGTELVWIPPEPRAGQPLEIRLQLSAGAAAARGAELLSLRLAQYRVEEQRSGRPERCVQTLEARLSRQASPSGELCLVARFELPEDAPAQGAVRGGESVDWRLELQRPDSGLEIAYPVPVQAGLASQGSDAPDALSRQPSWQTSQQLAQTPLGAAPPALPSEVRARENDQAWTLEFSLKSRRWLAGLLLLPLGLLSLLLHERRIDGLLPLLGSGPGLASALLLALLLHAASQRWTLSLSEDGLLVQRHSWLWRRRLALAPAVASKLFHRLSYRSRQAGRPEQAFHALYVRTQQPLAERQLTPGLPGPEAAEAVGQFIRWAQQQQQGRFSPGGQRETAQRQSYPRWGWLLWLALLLLWAELLHPPV